MKFGQFVSYFQRKKIIKKFYENYDLKLVPGPLVFAKNEAQLLLEK